MKLSSGEIKQIETLKGAIVVSKGLFKSCGMEEYSFLEEMIRYIELISIKLNIGLLALYRSILGYWLVNLKKFYSDFADSLAEEYGVSEILQLSSRYGIAYCVEEQIIQVVSVYGEVLKNKREYKDNRKWLVSFFSDIFDLKRGYGKVVDALLNIIEDEKYLVNLQAVSVRILIVDPEETITPLISLPLKKEGFDVKVVADADGALALLDEWKPHIVIAEKDLRIVDGVELYRKIKEEKEYSYIKFILMGKRIGKAKEKELLRMGCIDVIKKPVDIEVLSIKLKTLAESIPKEEEKESITGRIEDIQLPDLIQLLAASGKDLVLEIELAKERGSIYLKAGEIISVAFKDLIGEEAFYELMKVQNGKFSVKKCLEFPARNIEKSVMSLLMEASRLMDEGLNDGKLMDTG